MEGFKPVLLAYSTHEPVSGADETLAPIIYLHGMSSLKENWADIPQKVANATKRRSYSVDARNHGDSEWSDDFGFDLNAEDLVHFLDNLEIQRAILVGHSMGGITAMKTALKWPDRVVSLVVEDTFARKPPKPLLNSAIECPRMICRIVENLPAGLSDGELGKFIFQQLVENGTEGMVRRVKKRVRDGKYNFGPVLFRRDDEGRLCLKCNAEVIGKLLADYDAIPAELKGVFVGPAFFIYGTHSSMKVGDDEEHIKRFFPNAVFEGMQADHNVHEYKPGEFTDAVLRFLS